MRCWYAALLSMTTLVAALGTLSSCRLDPLVVFCELGDCNDGNPCTVDSCDEKSNACVFTPLAAGTDCGDDDICNGIERCNANAICEHGAAPVVSDGDPCTEDICEPHTGAVSHTPIVGCNVTTAGWQLLNSDGAPSPRTQHSGVWTGSEMIIWGGRVPGQPNYLNDGFRYQPQRDQWTPISSTGAPTPRHSHTALWTGDRMLIWGGYSDDGYAADGALYDPVNDSWTPMSNVGAPSGRTLHRHVWTGSEMIVWGGIIGPNAQGDGARYNPATDSWSTMSMVGAPSPRYAHHFAYSGSEVVAWGGSNTFDWLDTGGYYNPSTDSWTGATSTVAVPHVRQSGSGVWTAQGLFVWGGWDGGNFLADGGTLTPTGDWAAVSTLNAPTTRARQATVVTSEGLFVWGGCSGMACDVFRNDGALYQPDGDGGVWSPFSSEAQLVGRIEHAMVWTGSEIIVWGGLGPDGVLGDGARATLGSR